MIYRMGIVKGDRKADTIMWDVDGRYWSFMDEMEYQYPDYDPDEPLLDEFFDWLPEW